MQSSQSALGRPAAAAAIPPTIPLRRRLLLSSDFDDTLFGSRSDARHERATADFAAVFPRLAHPLCGTPAKLVVNTGRTLPLFADHPDAERRLRALGLRADALIAGVGTRVYWRRGEHERAQGEAAAAAGEEEEEQEQGPGGVWFEDASWTAAVGDGWDAALARRAVEQALLLPMARDVGARLQRDEELHEHKLTLTLEGGETAGDAEALCAEIARAFAALGASREAPRFVAGPCGGGGGIGGIGGPGGAGTAAATTRRRRWYVDVLPSAAGKGNAMLFVARALGYSADEVASAGDSHNDRCMLELACPLRHQRRAIVVGNAHPALRAALGGLAHVWVAPEGCVGAAAVLRGLCAGGEEGWVEAAAVAAVLGRRSEGWEEEEEEGV